MEKKNYIDYIVEETKKILAIDSPSGYTKEVAEYVLGEYRALGYEPKLTVKGGVLVALGGKNKEDAVMLEAHIDTLGAIVTEIKSNGRLKVSPIGGMNANNAEAENCRVATRFSGTFEGTCQLSNASVHVNGDYSDTKLSKRSAGSTLPAGCGRSPAWRAALFFVPLPESTPINGPRSARRSCFDSISPLSFGRGLPVV